MNDSHIRRTKAPEENQKAVSSEGRAGEVDAARFERRELLGEGGMALVHLAFDRLMQRTVAMKTLRGDLAHDERNRRRFIEEARLTGRLGHPNIVPVYGINKTGTEVSFTMKPLEGAPFSRSIERFRAAPTDARLHELMSDYLKVCDAVAFAHDHGVIHCDLKPENIFVGAHGQVYVVDWGVALVLGREEGRPQGQEPRDATHGFGGTLGFMAPEQLQSDVAAIGPATDVYGLGGVLCMILTGKPPRSKVSSSFTDLTETLAIDERNALPTVPPELFRIAQKALHPEPSKRYASVEELKREVESFMAGGGWFATRRYRAGDVILRENEAGAEAFIIAEGVCDVFRAVTGGARRRIRSMGAGETFGELSLLTGKPRSATVVAQTDVILRRITQQALDRELERNPVLASFMSAVASRFSELESKLDHGDD